MAYSVFWSQEALGFLNSLDHGAQERILQKLSEASENPDHYFHKLVGKLGQKLRIGDYRLIAIINKPGKRITVIELGHRRNVYK